MGICECRYCHPRPAGLVPIKFIGRDKWRNPIWLYKCSCGKEVERVKNEVERNNRRKILHCGCHSKSSNGHSALGAGSVYNSWRAMMGRCYSPKHSMYKYYGGRGITVFSEWHNYQNFLRDTGPRPPGLTAHRIDGDKNYEPENFKWATGKEQRKEVLERKARHALEDSRRSSPGSF